MYASFPGIQDNTNLSPESRSGVLGATTRTRVSAPYFTPSHRERVHLRFLCCYDSGYTASLADNRHFEVTICDFKILEI